MAGQLRVDEITDEAGTGSPSFPFGLPVGYAAGGTAPAAGSFTNVSDDVLEPGDPIRSVDILAIKENTEFLFDGASFEVIDEQTFTSSGTWTKPAGVNDETDIIVAILVGGGGSGAARFDNSTTTTRSASGGGCGCAVFVGRIKNLAGSGTLTIGAGGAAVVSTSGTGAVNGITGGNTTLVFSGNTITGDGGGLGRLGAGSATGFAGGGSTNSPIFNFILKGKDSRVAAASDRPRPLFGGGGSNAHSGNNQHPQNREGGPAFTFFGTTLVGAGGAGAQQTAQSGQSPGGGGGGASSNTGTLTSGAGGDGGATIFVVRGIASAETINFTTLLIP